MNVREPATKTPARRARSPRPAPVNVPARPARTRAAQTTQRLGSSELLFTTMRRFTTTNVLRVVSIDGHLRTETVERALRELEHRHPMLRATLADEPRRFVYDSARPIRLHVAALRDEQHVHELVETLLRTTFPESPEALFEVHLLRDERSARSELVIVGDHAFCDGISMNALAAELVELCDGSAPRPPLRTLPVLEKLLPSFTAAERFKSFGTALARLVRVAVLRRLTESQVAAKDSSYDHFEFDRDDTRQFVERARGEGTTITGLLMAAILHAIREQRSTSSRLAMSVPVNLRPRIPRWGLQPEDLGNYTNATYLESRATDDLWDDSRELRAQLDGALEDDGMLASLPLVFNGGRMLIDEGRVPLAHAMVSNSGVVSMRVEHGEFRVVGFRSATSVPMISTDFAFFCNTFDGRLSINLVFSERIASREEARRLLVRIAEILVRSTES